MLRTACLFTLAFSIAATSSAAPPQWVRASPFGGPVAALVQAPSAPRILYAAAENGRFFRSLDGGATWHRRGQGTGEDRIADLVADPHDARTLYARTGGFSDLFRTRDGGLTWSPIAPDLEVYAVAAAPDRPGLLFVAARDGLYRSDDGGDSWSLATLAGRFVDGVAVDPRAAGTIYAAVDGAYTEEPVTVWKSTDSGATWFPVSLSEPLGYDPGLSHFVIDPVRPDVLYLFFGSEYSSTSPVLRSTDGGASWSVLPAAAGIRDLVVSPEGTLFAATDLGLARSEDGGITWVPPLEPGFPAGPPLDPLRRLLVSSAAPGELFVAGSSGIWKSGDHGASWALSNQGILAQGASEVAVAPAGPPAVFALAWISLFRSADRGDTWTRLQSYFDGPQPYKIEAFDPRHPRTIYGIDTDGQAALPVVSTNGGRRWSKLPIPFNCDSVGSICDVTLAAVVLDRDGALVTGGSYYFHFQGGGSFLLRSEDGGQTWQELPTIPFIRDLVVDPRRPDTYHALSCEGLFRSRDNGTTWRKTGRGLPENLCISSLGGPVLAIDPQEPRRFYVGTSDQGVFASSDGGATFRPMNRGLENEAIATLLIDPTDSTRLYAGVPRFGVFRWNAGKGKWTPLNKGLPLAEFTGVLAIDPRHPSLLYAASPVEGVFRLDLEDSAP